MTPVWLDKLEEAVRKSYCRSDVLRQIGLPTEGSGNHRTVQDWIDKLALDTNHFDYRRAISEKVKARISERYRYDENEVLTETSKASITTVRKYARQLLKYECAICENTGMHLERPLSLQLDHINGDRTNHARSNLRWLCPNCHSQTETYSSKNRETTPFVSQKQSYIPKGRGADRLNIRKAVRPSKEVLQALVEEHGWRGTGKLFGVSDNSVRKWAKRYGLL